MTEKTKPQTSTGRRAIILAGRLLLMGGMLLLITAMANRNISDFVYQGF